MPFAFTVEVETAKQIAGRFHTTYIVTETGTTSNSEWEIDVPEHFTITLLEVDLDVSGGANNVKPEYGVTSGWTVDAFDHVYTAPNQTAYSRDQPSIRVVASGKKLYGRSKPNATASEVKTRITLVEGHDW